MVPPPRSVLPAHPVPTSPSAQHTLTPAALSALDITPGEIIRNWLNALSPTAARTYRLALTRFTRWALADPTAPPESALRLLTDLGCGPAHHLVTRWRDLLLSTGLATGSVAAMTASISSMLKAVRRAGLIEWRLESVSPRIERRHDRSGPTRAQVDRLLRHLDAAAAVGDPTAVRDRAIVLLLFGAAMRRAEVTGLRLRDVQIDPSGDSWVFPIRKGHRERQPLLIPGGAAAAVDAWLRVRGDAPGALFHSVPARGDGPRRPLAGESIRRLLAHRAREAGIEVVVRPHGLRHAAATEVARLGSLDQLMAIGGWKSFSAAQAYLDRRASQRRAAMAQLVR
jgi:integrase/recombinase XerC